MIDVIQKRITTVVRGWKLDLLNLAGDEKIIALNFGAQKVYDGFELYLSGHTWYDGYDLWLHDEQWSPNNNYVSLGEESLAFDRLEILEEYENVLKNEIVESRDLYREFIVVVGLMDGDFKRLK